MSTVSSRRILIVVLLLSASVVGALMRLFSARSSTVYDMGTLLLVMWVPAVGNIIAFLIKKASPVAAPPPAFTADMPFVAQLTADVQWSTDQLADPGDAQDNTLHCLLITGTEGFSARLSVPEGHAPGAAVAAQVQFLFPDAALPKFSVGSTFQVMQGPSAIGTGQVRSLSAVTPSGWATGASAPA